MMHLLPYIDGAFIVQLQKKQLAFSLLGEGKQFAIKDVVC